MMRFSALDAERIDRCNGTDVMGIFAITKKKNDFDEP